MLSKARFSIAFLMVVILLVAVDFAALRSFQDWGGLILALMPMINILTLTWPVSRKAGRFQNFWKRFQSVGWMVVILFFAMALVDSQLLFAPIILLVAREYFPNGSMSALCFLSVAIIVIYTTPQLLTTTLIAWFTTNHGLTMEHTKSSEYES